jgi:hypothetical protein
MGHSRQFGDVPVTSASPPKADIHREVRHVRLVPITVILACPLSGTLLHIVEYLSVDESAPS